MDSVGEILAKTRKEKGYSIESVSREANISKSYIHALEGENPEPFPGETYFLGFLRIYAEFLDLDANRLLNLYKNMILQEQAPPLDKLLGNSRDHKKWLKIGLVAALIAGIGAGVFFLSPQIADGFSTIISYFKTISNDEDWFFALEGEDYLVPEKLSNIQVKANSRLVVGDPLSGHRIIVENIDSSAISVRINNQTTALAIGGQSAFDLSGDGRPDLVLKALEVSADKQTAFLTIDIIDSPVALEADNINANNLHLETDESKTIARIGLSDDPKRRSQPRIIGNALAKTAFEIVLSFTGDCYVRFLVDDQEPKEGFYQDRQNLNLAVQAEAAVWLTNSSRVEMLVNNQKLTLNQTDEVEAGLISWRSNPQEGNFNLVWQRLY